MGQLSVRAWRVHIVMAATHIMIASCLLLVAVSALPSPHLVKRAALSDASDEIATFNGFLGSSYYQPYGFAPAWGYGSSSYGYHSMVSSPVLYPTVYGRYYGYKLRSCICFFSTSPMLGCL